MISPSHKVGHEWGGGGWGGSQGPPPARFGTEDKDALMSLKFAIFCSTVCLFFHLSIQSTN